MLTLSILKSALVPADEAGMSNMKNKLITAFLTVASSSA